MIIFKNFFSFVLTWFAYNWLITGGIEKTLVTIAAVQVGVCALSIPMCKSRGVIDGWRRNIYAVFFPGASLTCDIVVGSRYIRETDTSLLPSSRCHRLVRSELSFDRLGPRFVLS